MNKTNTFMASIVALAVFSIATAPLAQNAFAEEFHPGEANWGKATAWYAENYGVEQGEHASDPNGSGSSNDDGFSRDPGRDGLGNLYQAFDGDWCALLDFLEDTGDDGDAENDEIVLTCEEQVNGE